MINSSQYCLYPSLGIGHHLPVLPKEFWAPVSCIQICKFTPPSPPELVLRKVDLSPGKSEKKMVGCEERSNGGVVPPLSPLSSPSRSRSPQIRSHLQPHSLSLLSRMASQSILVPDSASFDNSSWSCPPHNSYCSFNLPRHIKWIGFTISKMSKPCCCFRSTLICFPNTSFETFLFVSKPLINFPFVFPTFRQTIPGFLFFSSDFA